MNSYSVDFVGLMFKKIKIMMSYFYNIFFKIELIGLKKKSSAYQSISIDVIKMILSQFLSERP